MNWSHHIKPGESWPDYVARVGSAFAAAMARSEAMKLNAKADSAKKLYTETAQALDPYFESTEGVGEDIFSEVFETYGASCLRQAAKQMVLAREAFEMDLRGTDPGTQEYLDRYKIPMNLYEIHRQLEGKLPSNY